MKGRCILIKIGYDYYAVPTNADIGSFIEVMKGLLPVEYESKEKKYFAEDRETSTVLLSTNGDNVITDLTYDEWKKQREEETNDFDETTTETNADTEDPDRYPF